MWGSAVLVCLKFCRQYECSALMLSPKVIGLAFRQGILKSAEEAVENGVITEEENKALDDIFANW